ncbi:MAG: hypothetical protein NTZ95_04085 [Candidatus Omnitrophica bacterium]|nr:hypothetical protein [Candidatus Omnitrophota bacterium]
MDKKDTVHEYYSFVKGMGQLLSLFNLYGSEHPVFRQKVLNVFTVIEKLILREKTLILSESGEIFLVNGEKIEAQDSMTKRLVQYFNNLKLGSLDLVSGLNIEEFVVFIRLLSQTEPLTGHVDITNYLDAKGTKHIIPRFTTYKLVKEGEKVVKDLKDVIKTEVSPDMKGRFLQDLKNGIIDGHLKEEKKEYQLLAHDPVFLCEFMCSLIDKNSSAEDVVKILWLIGDYLINEITTAKEGDANHTVLTELEDHFFYFWEKKEEKAVWHEAVKKAFNEMGISIEMKGVATLYKKHKKELEVLTNKIKGMLKGLASDSKAYKKAKEMFGVSPPTPFF